MGDTLVFKALAPNSAHHAIHVNFVVYWASPAIGPARQSRLRKWEQNEREWVQKFVKIIARLHRFRFCSADITPWVYWLDYRQVIFVSLVKGRGKLIKLLEVKCETERQSGQVRYYMREWQRCNELAVIARSSIVIYLRTISLCISLLT